MTSVLATLQSHPGTIHTGDCLEVMAGLPENSVDAVVCDPPYGLEFMGKSWDAPWRKGSGAGEHNAGFAQGMKLTGSGNPTNRLPSPEYLGGTNPTCRNCGGTLNGNDRKSRRRCRCDAPVFPNTQLPRQLAYQQWCEAWATEALRVAKPGAYLLAFGGTRTYHRLAVAVEDAGWIIRDCLVWAYASGFPKSRALLKPAWEPIVMARKPGPLRELAIDACRIGFASDVDEAEAKGKNQHTGYRNPGSNRDSYSGSMPPRQDYIAPGRWPANVILGDAIFEPGVPGVVIGGSLTGTMTAWSSSPDIEPSPIGSPASSADLRSSRGVPGGSFPGSATGPAGTQLDAWGTSTDTNRTDTGCSDGTTVDADAISGSTGRSGRTPTDPSQGATSSTTGMATDSTTDSTTLSASAEPNTSPTTSPSAHGSTEWRDSGSLSGDAANWRRNSPPAGRDGQPSAERRYTDNGGTDFAPLPGDRRPAEASYSRFFLIPKSARSEREPVFAGATNERVVSVWGGDEDDLTPGKKSTIPRRNNHPTVKPLDLMRHLVRLVTPVGGVCLDPFLGSGTTAIAAEMEGFAWIGIEREESYVEIARARLMGVQKGLGLAG